MNTKQKKIILGQLTEKLQNMAIPVLSKALEHIGNARKIAILNILTPEKFKALVAYEFDTVEFGELWPRGQNGLSCTNLDALEAHLLVYIGAQHCISTSGWMEWREDNSKSATFAGDITKYFACCSNERIAQILAELIKSTDGVKAPASERDYDIFVFTKKKQFPFEAIAMLWAVHPKQLFAAMNTLSLELFKRLLWLTDAMRGENDNIESVFANSYSSEKGAAYIDDDIMIAIVAHVGALDNQKLYMLLPLFNRLNQLRITESLGRNRLVEMKKQKYLDRSIATPSEMSLYADVDPNERVIEEILEGKKTVRQLKSKKVVELLGELALS